MKETKVYVDELPEYCDDCPCSLRDKDDCAYCNLLHKNIGYDFGKRPKHCPLQSLKTHDQELVKEVCEKIRNAVNKSLEEIGGNCNGELYGQYVCKGLVDYDSIEFDEILAQIQRNLDNE